MTRGLYVMSRELAAIRSRSRRTLATSAALHAALFIWLMLHQEFAPAQERLVEVAWIDPPAPAVETRTPAPETTVPDVPQRTEADPAPASSRNDQRFVRTERVAEEAPRPQEDRARRDEMQARLANLRRTRDQRPDLAASVMPDTRALAAIATPRVESAGVGAPAELVRRETPGRSAPLTRGPAPRSPSRLAAAVMPRPASPPPVAASDENPPPARMLGTARLTGEVADRSIVVHVMPAYPSWAMQEAVEADVTVHFTVLADGTVKENVQVVKTAGFADFDDAALAAIRRWRFAPLEGAGGIEQWGRVTFHFRLRDQR
jgi:TonB family protein